MESHANRSKPCGGILPIALTLLLSLLFAASAHGALKHKYNFNDGTANDSVGNAGFTLNGAAGVGSGKLVLPGGGHLTNYASAEGAALTELWQTLSPPSGTLSSAVSIELWFNQSVSTNWSKLFMAGIDVGGAFEYMDITPVRGDANGFSSSSLNSGGFNGANENNAQTTSTLVSGTDYYLSAIWDNTTFDDVSAGTLTIHRGPVGGVLDTQSVTLGLDNFLSELANDPSNANVQSPDFRAYIGSAVQFGDADFNGSIDEMRIHDSPLTSTEVNASFATGPDIFLGPTPTLTINRDTGNVILSNPGSPVQVTELDITSVAGSLNMAGWNSISDNADANDGGSFDALSNWSISSSTALQLTESADSGLGGTLSNNTVNLGAAWLQSTFEDILATATLSGGGTTAVDVNFVGNGDAAFGRSDLNFDGTVNASDWPLFLSGTQIDMSGRTSVEAYRMGDLNGSFTNDYADFQLFYTDFVAINGPAAFASLVPEPGSLSLLLMGMLFIGRRSQRQGLAQFFGCKGPILESAVTPKICA